MCDEASWTTSHRDAMCIARVESDQYGDLNCHTEVQSGALESIPSL